MLALAAVQSAPAAPPVPPVPVAPPPAPAAIEGAPTARQAAALSLAQLLFPLDRQKALFDRAAGADMRAGLLKDPQFAAMEADHPGLLAAIFNAMMPVMHRSLETQLPVYHRGVAAIYARHMTMAELGDAYRFFSSSAGQSLVARVNENISFSAIVDQALANPDGPIRRADIDKTKSDAARQTVDSMTGAELSGIQGIIGKSWVTKLPAVRREVSLYDTKFYNEPDPAMDAELQRVMEGAMADFLARSGKSISN